MHLKASLAVVGLATILGGTAPTAGAQGVARPEPEPLFRRSELWGALALTAVTIALLPVDQAVAERLSHNRISDSLSGGDGHKNLTEPIANVNEYRLFYASAGTWAIARLAGRDRMSDLAWHATEAIVVSRILTDVVGGLAGRARPRVNMDAKDFELWRGFTTVGYHAFPSRHAAAAFAFATVLTKETKRYWPDATLWVAIPAYALATTVGFGRMYTDHHWATDVLVAAAFGYFAGAKVVRYSHTHPNNTLDRIMLGRRTDAAGEMQTLIGIQRNF